eukprot:UN05298
MTLLRDQNRPPKVQTILLQEVILFACDNVKHIFTNFHFFSKDVYFLKIHLQQVESNHFGTHEVR